MMMSSIMIRGLWRRSALYFALAGIISLGIYFVSVVVVLYIPNTAAAQLVAVLLNAFAFIARYMMLSIYYLAVMELRKNEAQKAGRIQ
jgi:hypothetical protein